MSVDLLVFGMSVPLSAEAAGRIYAQVCGGGDGGLEPDVRIADFHRDLLARFPALESLSDYELGRLGELRHVVWSMSPVAAPGHVALSILSSRAGDAVEPVLELAARHGLSCYDPQARQMHQPALPGRSGDRPKLRLTFCDGACVDDPEPRDIAGLLGRLSARNWFARLEGAGSYVQVGIGQRAGGVPAGSYAVEYRDDPDDDDSHLRAVVNDLDEVVAVFRGYILGDHAWKAALAWAPALAF